MTTRSGPRPTKSVLREILRMRINDTLVLHTEQPVKRIEEDTARDDIMTAEQGKEYGIMDDVIRKRAQRVCAPSPQPGVFQLTAPS